MERLALVRKKREDDAKKREAEGRKPGMSAYGIDSDGGSDSSDEEVFAYACFERSTLLKKNVFQDGSASASTAKAAKAPAPLSESAAKKKAAAAEVVTEDVADAGKLEVLKSIDIKKMNGDALKEHLKARGLDVQGAKKDLMQRLIDHEKTRA